MVLPNSSIAGQDSNSRFLLVELDVSTDIDQESDVTTDETVVPEAEGEPADDLEPLPEDDEEDAMAKQKDEPETIRSPKTPQIHPTPLDPQAGHRSSSLDNFYNTYFLDLILLPTQNRVKILNVCLQTLESALE